MIVYVGGTKVSTGVFSSSAASEGGRLVTQSPQFFKCFVAWSVMLSVSKKETGIRMFAKANMGAFKGLLD